MDPYRAATAGAAHPQQQQHATFSPRQQQNSQQQFAHYAEASFIDLPALEEPGAEGGGYGGQGGRGNGQGQGSFGGGGMGKWV